MSELRELYFSQLEDAKAEIESLKQLLQKKDGEIQSLKRQNAHYEREFPSDGKYILIPLECPDRAIQAGLYQVRETISKSVSDDVTDSFGWGDMVATWADMLKALEDSAITCVDLGLLRNIYNGDLAVLPADVPDPEFCDALFDELRLHSFTDDETEEPYIALANINGEKIYQLAISLKSKILNSPDTQGSP